MTSTNMKVATLDNQNHALSDPLCTTKTAKNLWCKNELHAIEKKINMIIHLELSEFYIHEDVVYEI